MAREWMLLAASATVTLVLGLALLRWLAPELLGAPPDLRIVRASEEVVPFYENAFGDRDAGDFILNDPYTLVRARPLVPQDEGGVRGPTDLLGFRNLAVPNRTDVLLVGDSQTYGINVPFEDSWPAQLAAALRERRARVYSMAIGGWGAVQYLDMFDKGMAFEPRVAVVAFYGGNDAMESFRLAYGVEHWASLRPNPDLDLDDRPPREKVSRANRWLAKIPDGPRVAFTPPMRFYSVQRHPVVDAGWAIMAEAARRIAEIAQRNGVTLILTVIPTKELAYAPRLAAAGVAAPGSYTRLVGVERERIDALALQLRALPGARYVDLVGPFQRSVSEGVETHPRKQDGHPSTAGYVLIARTLHPVIEAAFEAGSEAVRASP